MTLQNDDVLICSQLMRHQLIKLFHLSNLLQMLNDCVEWLTLSSLTISHVVVRGSASMVLSVAVNFQWPVTMFLIFKALVSFAKVLEYCMLVVPEPNVLLMLWLVSATLWFILNLNKKIIQICFLSNIISIV